ncbi:MAG: hypothetical protein U9N44_03660 [Chloroflexota bacterium]|nr:hypothetical protein [Chloroflexota bacterium]
MKRYLKFGSIALATVLVVTIAVSTLAFADTSGGVSGDTDPGQVFIGKVADILELDEAVVAGAFAQAGRELFAERQQERLQQAVENGLITEEEAAEIQAWFDGRPDCLEGLGPMGGKDRFMGHGHGMGPFGQFGTETE